MTMKAPMHRKLIVESLEPKKLLAADVSLGELPEINLSNSGELSIQGTDASDSVVVEKKGNKIRVKIGSEKFSFKKDDVLSIRFD